MVRTNRMHVANGLSLFELIVTFVPNAAIVIEVRLWVILCFCLMTLTVYGQVDSLNSVPGPKDGVNKLALQFLKINFTAAQRELLEGITLEFIFYVDSTGKATLEDVNGINDRAIFDSLTAQRNSCLIFIRCR